MWLVKWAAIMYRWSEIEWLKSKFNLIKILIKKVESVECKLI